MNLNKSGEHRRRRHYTKAHTIFPWLRGQTHDEELKMWLEIERWCEENLQDDWTAADMGIIIYEAEDAMAFKLRWI